MLGYLPEKKLGNLPQVQSSEIADGFAGNKQTLSKMIELAKARRGNPMVRRLAENILDHYQVGSHDYQREVIAIGDFVKQKVRYTKDPAGIEYVQDPLLMIENMSKLGYVAGDCDDMSLLVATLLLSVGHEPYFKVVKYSPNSSSWNHIYVYVNARNTYGDTKWISVDAIAKNKKIGYEVPHSGSELYRII